MANENQKTFTIIVNTRKKDWHEETISYKDVIILAFGTYSDDPNTVYTVDYLNGPKGHTEGSLTKNQHVKVVDGMIFNVTETHKS